MVKNKLNKTKGSENFGSDIKSVLFQELIVKLFIILVPAFLKWMKTQKKLF